MLQNTFDKDDFTSYSGVKVKSTHGSKLTTYSIGGELSNFIEIANEQELSKSLAYLSENKIVYRIIGAGSNLLIADEGIVTPVLRLNNNFRYLRPTEKENIFLVGASSSLMSVTRELSEQGMSGLEFAGGIPASFGGAIRMNAGAHGGEISNIVDEVTFYSSSGEKITLSSKEIEFNYRRSSLTSDAIVTEVKIKMLKSDPQATRQAREHNLQERKLRQPLTQASAGSVFKNPSPDNTAGKLIEEAGLKGYKYGQAEVSKMHANWIVNPARQAKAADILHIIQKCQSEVSKQFNINLHQEVIFWG